MPTGDGADEQALVLHSGQAAPQTQSEKAVVVREDDPLRMSPTRTLAEIRLIWEQSLDPTAEDCFNLLQAELTRYIRVSLLLDQVHIERQKLSWLNPFNYTYNPAKWPQAFKLYMRSLGISSMKQQAATEALETLQEAKRIFDTYTQMYLHEGTSAQSSPASILSRDEALFLRLEAALTTLATDEQAANNSSWLFWRNRYPGQLAAVFTFFKDTLLPQLKNAVADVRREASRRMRDAVHPAYGQRRQHSGIRIEELIDKPADGSPPMLIQYRQQSGSAASSGVVVAVPGGAQATDTKGKGKGKRSAP